MASDQTTGPQITVPPVDNGADLWPKPRRSFHRWRALSLSLVYIVFGAHIIHWKVSGKTLAPLELNEVMYTLELGIITAGFLFMCALVLGSLIFGRFFCSWACHIMVLQDLCAWLLRKLRIRQKPIRSRLLLFVPPLTACYMFLWPQIVRTWQARTFPEFHLRTDAEGWASFATTNFWRNLPSAPIIILTFVVCGFIIVYLLGSRSFCTYVCPYGAIFGLADRFSPGRIRANLDKCRQCGTCTATCTTGIRVHEEVKTQGMVVNPACLKDLDCISACPQGALSYGFTKPALFKSYRIGRFGLPYQFSLAEDVLMAFIFLAVLLSFRGLYSRIPFLLSLALGGIVAVLTVKTVRLFFRPEVKLATMRLKLGGRITLAGYLYVLCFSLLSALVVHSAFVRFHEFNGLKQAMTFDPAAAGDDAGSLARKAYTHLTTADRWGLFRNERVERNALKMAAHLREYDAVEAYAARLLERNAFDASARLQLGQALAARNDTTKNDMAEAARAFSTIIEQWHGAEGEPPSALAVAHQALGGLFAQRGNFEMAARNLLESRKLDPTRATVHAELGSVLAEMGRLGEAQAALEEAVRIDPALGGAQYNLGAILAHQGRFDEAIACYERALDVSPDEADTHTNLGFALIQTGQIDRARQHLERALSLDPKHAAAHFNLGNVLASQNQMEEATRHLAIAARLDPRYARFLKDRQSP
jgi:tetratricopeptide (TPR) repeat protein/ferredoxin